MDKRLNIIVPDDLYEQVRNYAHENRVSFAHVVRVALVAYLKKQAKK